MINFLRETKHIEIISFNFVPSHHMYYWLYLSIMNILVFSTN